MTRQWIGGVAALCLLVLAVGTSAAQELWKPYSPLCTERKNVFEFTEKPTVKLVGPDRVIHPWRNRNFDTAPGGPKGCKPAGTDIGITCARYIGGTDNYLCFEDWGERIVVLRLEYEAEEALGVPAE